MPEVVKAVLRGTKALDRDAIEYEAKFLDEAGEVVVVGGASDDVLASDVLMTGYAIGTAGAVAPGDNVMQVIAKLEKRILDLETP